VIHIAGAVGYQSWKNCRKINRDGMQHIINETVNAGIKRFIHISSVSVYGRVPDVPIDEDFPLKKIGDPYGDTKIEAEHILRRTAKRENLDITVLRPTAVYGKGDNKFLPSLLRNLKSGKFRMIGDGTQTVDLVNVSDVADSVLVVLENDRSIGKTYNIAQTGNPTWNEFLAFVSKELNLPLTEKHVPYKVAYIAAGLMEWLSAITRKPPRLSRYAIRLVGKQYIYVTDHIRQELGFSPAIGLIEGIRECLPA
jgi:nucleoside-diphosphate-sugar epimerase